ncbi:PadR family transcriptional regulator [Allokutzneria sp. NRRL B-24872]|uniref:PadR family transcriptional regulator n=1 Tax=Allokutzneria sp. NRRL B-24872 TaxID=1137961 RepID=UPI000A3D3417|nr:PadR family transcriptional regulator [Allokutzneria sp. NRRL B-24872]
MEISQVLKGVLDLAVLTALRGEDRYGYDVVRGLRAAGLEAIGDASVYGTLQRLARNGLLTSYLSPSETGPPRKYYRLTDEGRDHLRASTSTWRSFVATMDELMGPE